MSSSNTERVIIWRYKEAYELLQDPSTSFEGSVLLRELLESSRAEMGPWFRLKCCLLLSVYSITIKEARELLDEAQLLYDILSSLPQERLMESVREKLLHAPDDLRRARECIAQQLRGVRNADRAERGLAPATDADDTGSDASSDEGYIDVFLTELDHAEHPVSAKQPEPAAQPEPTEQPELAEQSEPANQPEPAEEPSAENDEATRLTPEPPTAQGPSSQS